MRALSGLKLRSELLEDWDPSLLFRIVDVAAVIANGLLGGAVARAFRFDVVGFLLLAVLSGMGGGLIRDTLLSTGFPVALTDSAYWAGAMVAARLAYFLDLGSQWASRVLVIVDFLGMGCWAATGTIKALGAGLHWIPSIALGITTAVGGGVLRDIMVNRVPSILGGNSLYATVALVGASETALLTAVFDRPNLGMGIAFITCLALGLMARRKNWRLPAPVNLKVPRPQIKLFNKRARVEFDENEGWTPGQPITENLQILTPEQIRKYRKRDKFTDIARFKKRTKGS